MNIHLYLHTMRIRDENKIEAIHIRAVEILVKDGFDGLSMQKLAKAANVSPATLYIYFKDREDLILKVAIKEAEKMIEASLKNFDPSLDFAKGLAIQWSNRANYWIKNPLHAKFTEQIRHSHIGELVFTKVKKEFAQIMGEFVKKSIQRKQLIELPLEVYWAIAFAPLYQLVKFHIDGTSLLGKKFTWSDAYMKQTLQLVLKALKP
jgi:AcrR family transcriptional regulator